MSTSPTSTPERYAEADKIADFIMLTQRSFLLDLSNALNDWKVSFAQFFLLGYLDKEEYLTMSDIAKKMGHSTAAATGLVDRLEKLGYVQRIHAEEDRRKVMVCITDEGRKLVRAIREEIKASLAVTMGELETEEREDISSSFERMAWALDGTR